MYIYEKQIFYFLVIYSESKASTNYVKEWEENNKCN